MNTIITGTMNETYKIFKRKKFIFLFSISMLVAIAASIINIVTGNSFGVSLFKNSTLPVTILNLMSSILLPLFAVLLTSDLFSGELADNSIIMSLVRPITRSKIYISKMLSIAISILVLLMATFAASFIASFFGGNLNDIISRLPANLISYVCALIPLMLVAVITAFTAQLTRSGSLTIVIMILASLLMSVITVFLPQTASFLPTTYMTWYQNFYSDVDASVVINELLYILSYGIIFMFAGTYLFEQKDI